MLREQYNHAGYVFCLETSEVGVSFFLKILNVVPTTYPWKNIFFIREMAKTGIGEISSWCFYTWGLYFSCKITDLVLGIITFPPDTFLVIKDHLESSGFY